MVSPILFQLTNPLYHALGNGTSDFTLQIGANNSTDNQRTCGIGSVTTESLRLSNTDVNSLSEAQSTINAIDGAIDFINDQRSNIGAITNRLEFALLLCRIVKQYRAYLASIYVLHPSYHYF